MQFTDSVSENLEVVRELLRGVPGPSRDRAKRAAVAVENIWNSLHKQYPKDPAVALGVAFAIFTIADRITTSEKNANGSGLIKLLS